MNVRQAWMLLVCLSLGSIVNAGIIAQTGFNDASGINADGIPSSPYTLGATIDGRGTSEPGWAEGWRTSIGGVYNGASIASVTSAAVEEGDGALYVRRDPGTGMQGWVYRQWSMAQTGAFRIDQYIQLPNGGSFISRPHTDGSPNWVGLIWDVSNGTFRVADGTTNRDTGISCLNGAWYKVSEVVDVESQTWRFFVNDNEYSLGHPLAFYSRVPQINKIDYLTSTDAYVDNVVVSSVPEPVAALILLPAALCLRRR